VGRSHLLEPAPRRKLVDVVRDVCGIHAQVMGAAELSISARVDGITQEDLRAELWEKRSLVKAWTIRGTLHLHPADDLPLWAAAARAVSEPEDAAVLDAIADALDRRCLLREELADEVAKRAGEWTREKVGSVNGGLPALSRDIRPRGTARAGGVAGHQAGRGSDAAGGKGQAGARPWAAAPPPGVRLLRDGLP
jgi:hypothetical protein